MDFEDYDDEGWNLDEYNDMNEQAPEQLPLETILEENSQMKDSPPQQATSKVSGKRPASGAKLRKSSKQRASSPSKRTSSPLKQSKTAKGKTMHQSPSGRRFPEMSEHERKLAESDAYLRKL